MEEQQSEQDPLAQTNKSSNELHHKVHRLSRIFVIFSALIGIATSIFFFYFYLTYQPPQAPLSISKPQTEAIDASREPNSSAEMANWKTYRNDEWEITFNYPPEYRLTKYEDIISIDSPGRNTKGNDDPKEDELNIQVFQETARRGITLDEFVRELAFVEQGKQSGITIDGVKGILLETPYGQVYRFLRNGNWIIINKSPVKTTRQNEFDQILSTFKFLDEEQISSVPENWQKYENKKYSMYYPDSWKIENEESDYYKDSVSFLSENYEREKLGRPNIIKGYRVFFYRETVPWPIPGAFDDKNITPATTKEITWLGGKAWLRHYDYEGAYTVLTTVYNNTPYQMVVEFSSLEDRKNLESLLLQVANTLTIK